MSGSGPDRRTIVWASPGRAGFVREVAELAGLSLVGAGSPEAARTGAVSQELGVAPCADLRTALTQGRVELVLIASAGDFGAVQDRDDAKYVLEAQKRGVRVLTLEPVPASAQEMTDARWDGTPVSAAEAVRFVPVARATRAFSAALDALEHFGAVRSMGVESVCRSDHGSLGARLLGAIDLVQMLLGLPETVDAGVVSPAQPKGYADQGLDTLRGMTGDACATMRFADGRLASLFCSDQGGDWIRRVVLHGEGGRIEAGEGVCRWIRPDGSVEEDVRSERRPSAAEVIAESIDTLLSPRQAMPPGRVAQTLSIAQAALLSMRTGQPESPESAMRMLRGV